MPPTSPVTQWRDFRRYERHKLRLVDAMFEFQSVQTKDHSPHAASLFTCVNLKTMLSLRPRL
jgi:hypothetical protein